MPQFGAIFIGLASMCKETFLSFLLFSLVLGFGLSTAQGSTGKDAKAGQRVKTAITKFGVGSDARVDIRLRDKARIKGYVIELADRSFVVLEDKTGSPVRIPYSHVKQAKGKNNLTGEEIALVAIGAAVVLFALFLL